MKKPQNEREPGKEVKLNNSESRHSTMVHQTERAEDLTQNHETSSSKKTTVELNGKVAHMLEALRHAHHHTVKAVIEDSIALLHFVHVQATDESKAFALIDKEGNVERLHITGLY